MDQQNLQFDDDVTEVTPAFEYHGPIQQIDGDPPSFIPGGTPFAQQPDDYAAYEENTQTMQPSAINHIAQPAPACQTATQYEQQANRGFHSARNQ